MFFFSSNVKLEAVASLCAIQYSFAVVFVYIFALCDEEKKYSPISLTLPVDLT